MRVCLGSVSYWYKTSIMLWNWRQYLRRVHGVWTAPIFDVFPVCLVEFFFFSHLSVQKCGMTIQKNSFAPTLVCTSIKPITFGAVTVLSVSWKASEFPHPVAYCTTRTEVGYRSSTLLCSKSQIIRFFLLGILEGLFGGEFDTWITENTLSENPAKGRVRKSAAKAGFFD